ncbi:MAG: hypothetical protein KBD24_00210 [Candidatus Pacebacteria bacterium]|nr:hypothetical protein [Candidatus Paceibacterota bacterium]
MTTQSNKQGAQKKRTSVNQPTIDQLGLLCRHVDEMKQAGLTENFAIRILEVVADVYAKLLHGGSATPHFAEHVDVWSLAATRAKKMNPDRGYGEYLRVEHGTPRRAFANLILDLYHEGKLTNQTVDELVRNYWKLAVITLGEDQMLAKGKLRSKMCVTPEERWAMAGIRFPKARSK